MSERLTQRLIDSLRPEKRDRIVFDKTIPGFGVRVFRSGRKSFLIQYRVQKKTRRFTLGNCNLLTPYEARNKAAKLLAGVRDGKDPAQTRLEALKAPTVADLAERYLCEYAAEKKSFTEIRRNLTRYGAILIKEFDALVDPIDLRLAIAASVFALATGPFRVHEANWPTQTERRISLAERWIDSAQDQKAK